MAVTTLFDNRELLIALLSGLGVFAAILFLVWPRLVFNPRQQRLDKITTNREAARLRDRDRRVVRPGGSLRLANDPRRIYRLIVDALNLRAPEDDSETVAMLRNAGYRGEAPVTVFLAARIIAPAVLFLLAMVYLFLVLKLDQSPFVKLVIASVVGASGVYAPTLYLRNKITKRQTELRLAWPDALDLLLICVESGMTIEFGVPARVQRARRRLAGAGRGILNHDGRAGFPVESHPGVR